MGAVSSIRNLRTSHAVVTRDPLNMELDFHIIKYQRAGRCSNTISKMAKTNRGYLILSRSDREKSKLNTTEFLLPT
jgi:hypothetical protein